MKVHYTGRPAPFSESQDRKLEAKFHKCHKVLGLGRDLEAHVAAAAQVRCRDHVAGLASYAGRQRVERGLVPRGPGRRG